VYALLLAYGFKQVSGATWRDMLLPTQADVQLWKKVAQMGRTRLGHYLTKKDA
jgi:hypothetical protein